MNSIVIFVEDLGIECDSDMYGGRVTCFEIESGLTGANDTARDV